jgi:hypothetical protein
MICEGLEEGSTNAFSLVVLVNSVVKKPQVVAKKSIGDPLRGLRIPELLGVCAEGLWGGDPFRGLRIPELQRRQAEEGG